MELFNFVMNKTFIVHGFDFKTMLPKLWTMEFNHVYPSQYVTAIQTDGLNVSEYLCRYNITKNGIMLYFDKNPNTPYDLMITKKHNCLELWVAGQGGAMSFKIVEDLSSVII